jgi:hypothetical protein
MFQIKRTVAIACNLGHHSNVRKILSCTSIEIFLVQDKHEAPLKRDRFRLFSDPTMLTPLQTKVALL